MKFIIHLKSPVLSKSSYDRTIPLFSIMIIRMDTSLHNLVVFCINLISISKIHCYNQSSIDNVKKLISTAEHILILTGPEITPELKYPNYRNENYMWRDTISFDLASHDALERTPGKVWEFFNYLRWLCLPFEPNQVHHTLAELQKRLKGENRKMSVITQCEDDLQAQAGIQNIIEMYGCIFRTKCIRCGEKEINRKFPICEALKGYEKASKMDVVTRESLPHCTRRGCHCMLGPDIVWDQSSLDKITKKNLLRALGSADLYIVIGSPTDRSHARAYQPQFEDKGVPCIEFNPVESERSFTYTYSFIGPLNETVPQILKLPELNISAPDENIEDMNVNSKNEKPNYKDDKPDWLGDVEDIF